MVPFRQTSSPFQLGRPFGVVIAAALVLVGLSTLATAQERTVDGDVATAFSGHAKIGKWAEFRVDLQNHSSENLKLQVACRGVDGDGVPVVYQQPGSCELAASGKQSTTLLALVGPLDSLMTFSASTDDGTVLWEKSIRVRPANGFHLPTQEVIATAGQSIGVKEFRLVANRGKADDLVDAAIDAPAQLPTDARAFDAIDVLAVVTSSRGGFSEPFSPEQLASIEKWVRQGGALWLIVGEAGPGVFGADSPWTRFTTAKLVGVERIRRSGPYEQLTNSPLTLDLKGGDESLPKISRLSVTAGRVERAELTPGQPDRPIVVRSPLSFGQVVITTIDLDQAPFANWPGRAVVLSQMLEGRSTARTSGTMAETIHGGTQLGFNDLAGQLRSAIDHFPALATGTFTLVGLITAAYLLLLGPGDYFLCRWFGRQWMHTTWITFPLLVAGFAGLAIALSNYSRQVSVSLNQFDVCDVDVANRNVRGFSVASLFSPNSRAFQLKLEIDPAIASRMAGPTRGTGTWLGLPGVGLGSLESANAEARGVAPPFKSPYRVVVDRREEESLPQLIDVPIQSQSSKPMVAEWESRLQDGDYGSIISLTGGRIQGQLVNPLGVELSDVRIVYDSRYYTILGKWAPGEKIDVDQVWPVSLEGRLRQRTGRDGKEFSKPWDPETRELSRIVDALFFYDAAGGREYVGMTNRYHARLDMSGLQRNGMAVVVGKMETPLSHWKAADQEPAVRRASYVRLVWPVTIEHGN